MSDIREGRKDFSSFPANNPMTDESRLWEQDEEKEDEEEHTGLVWL